MTGEEKRQLLKEQYKRDLLARKEFLEKAKQLRKSQKLTGAITEITSSLNMDDTDVWIEHLNRESAITEAKMEISMDLAKESGEDLLKAQVNEAEQQKLSAELLVLQMKKEMGLIDEVPEPAAEEPAPEAAKDAKEEEKPSPTKRKLGDF